MPQPVMTKYKQGDLGADFLIEKLDQILFRQKREVG